MVELEYYNNNKLRLLQPIKGRSKVKGKVERMGRCLALNSRRLALDLGGFWEVV